MDNQIPYFCSALWTLHCDKVSVCLLHAGIAFNYLNILVNGSEMASYMFC